MGSQHNEIFFGGNRLRGGSNNNSNCIQFKKTLRQLLITKNKNIKVEIFQILLLLVVMHQISVLRKRFIIKSDNNLDETEIDNYLDFFSSIELLRYTNEILNYIAGYIVKSICIKVGCPYCIYLLIKDLDNKTDHSYVRGANFTFFCKSREIENSFICCIKYYLSAWKIYSSCCCYK